MTDDPVFCRERAELERRHASASPLARVKERHLESAAAWDRMAERGDACRRSQARRAAIGSELLMPAE